MITLGEAAANHTDRYADDAAGLVEFLGRSSVSYLSAQPRYLKAERPRISSPVSAGVKRNAAAPTSASSAHARSHGSARGGSLRAGQHHAGPGGPVLRQEPERVVYPLAADQVESSRTDRSAAGRESGP